MDTITFNVTLTFSDDIEKKELREIAENILQALTRQVYNGDPGIAPEDSNAYTQKIQVSCLEMEGVLEHDVN